MSSKAEFYVALDHVKQAAKDALKAMPESLSGRERKFWEGLLSRLPEQIDDVRVNFDDPHTVTEAGRRRQDMNKLIIP